MNSSLLFLTCPPRVVKPLVEELTRQLEAGQSEVRVVKYGVLCKGQNGFLILAASDTKGFPSPLLDEIRHDEEITGYVTFSCESDLQEGHDDHVE